MDETAKTLSNDGIFIKLAKERALFLTGDLDGNIANNLVANLLWLDKQSSDEITFYINSTGGDINEGLMPLYDTFHYIKSPIKTICIGQAYSSAAILLAAGEKGRRFAYPNSSIMIHSVQVSEVTGTTSELAEESKRTKLLDSILMQMIACHTGQSLRKVKKDCLEDKYMNAKEAIEYGIVDEAVKYSKVLPELKKK